MELSVIIPAYNAEKYLEDCLRSVFKDVDIDYECIVVNDGSIDNTEVILEEFSSKEKRLRYITTSNRGVSAARNLGMEIAQGEYILFLDSDDYLLEDAMIKIKNDISSKKDLYVYNYFENRGKTPKKAIPIRDDLESCEEIIDFYAIKNNYLNSACGKLLKRDIIIKNKISFPANMKFAEDACFILNYLKHTHSCELYDTVLFNYRMHDTNSIKNVSKTRLKDYCLEMNERISLSKVMHKEESLNDLYKTYMYMLFYFCVSYTNNFSLKGVKEYYKDIKESVFFHEIMNNLKISDLNGFSKVVFVLLNKLNCYTFYFVFKVLDVIKKVKQSII